MANGPRTGLGALPAARFGNNPHRMLGILRTVQAQDRWIAPRDRLLCLADQMRDWSHNALTITRSTVETHADRVAGFATFPFNHMAQTAPDGPGPG